MASKTQTVKNYFAKYLKKYILEALGTEIKSCKHVWGVPGSNSEQFQSKTQFF